MPKYLKLSAPAFNADGRTPLGSYLRLGDVEEPSQAGNPEVPFGHPSGEDLASKIRSFKDDIRRRCAPHVEVEPGPTVESISGELAWLKSRREIEVKQRDFLEKQLEALDADLSTWLTDLVAYVEAAAIVLPELEAEILAERERLEAQQQSTNNEAAEEEKPPGPPKYCEEYLSPSARQAVTAKLHSRGGWRDHTDGNRISTTRGDKIEVVGGNYRLVVLGRERGIMNAARQPVLPGWDVSGGHVAKVGVTTGDLDDMMLPTGTVAESRMEWVKNWDGTWCEKTTQIKGDTETTTIGDTISYSYPKTEKSITGSEKPTETLPNPVVTDRSWSELTESYTGSKDCPVPYQYEETWADKIVSKTYVTSMIDITKAKKMFSSTVAEETFDKTVAKTMTSSTFASSTYDTTICGTQSSDTKGDTYSTTIGNSSDLFLGARDDSTTGDTSSASISASVDLFAGTKATITIGGSADLTVGATSSITLGPKIECTVALQDTLEQGFKTELAIVKGELAITTMWT